MPNVNFAMLLQLFHAQDKTQALHILLEATGAVVLIWQFIATIIPKATLWLVPLATRAAAAFALFLLANPIAGPVLRANKDKIVPLLRQLLDLINKVAGAFEAELEKDIESDPPPAAAAAGGQADAPKAQPQADASAGAAAQPPPPK